MAVHVASRAVVVATPPAWVALGTCLLAVAAGASTFREMSARKRRVLTYVNTLGTIVHEAGHALVSVLAGGHVYRIKIYDPDSGETHTGRKSRLAGIATTMAGYAMPSLAGLGAAELVHKGNGRAVLILTVVIMLAVLLVVRDSLTFVIVVLVGGTAFATLYWGSAWLQEWLAYAESWLLLTSEIGGVGALVATRRVYSRDDISDDARSLAQRTPIPDFVWILGWFAVIGWALWNGVPLLWPDSAR